MARFNRAILLFLIVLGAGDLALATETSQEFPVPPPPFSEGMFPCSDCHASMEVNLKRRELKEAHEDIVLHHGETMRWCLDCHYSRNKDKLRLYNGELIAYNESYRLCGECHGNVYNDWKAGIHGKRSGYFTGGKRTYLLCAHCHNPHDPKFKPMKPEPSPHRPTGKWHAK